MYIPVYLPKVDEIHLVFPASELNAAGLIVQNLLMLSKQEKWSVPPNIIDIFMEANQAREGLSLYLGSEYKEFAVQIIESVIERQEKDGDDPLPLKKFLEELADLEYRYLH